MGTSKQQRRCTLPRRATYDGGESWNEVATYRKRDVVRAKTWQQIADLGYVDPFVGVTIRIGVRAQRDALPGNADLSDSRCHLRVLIFSRDGASSPY